jgi:hypothetical protein
MVRALVSLCVICTLCAPVKGWGQEGEVARDAGLGVGAGRVFAHEGAHEHVNVDEHDHEHGDDGDGAGIRPGFLPTLASLVPGFLLHGSGTYLAHDKRAAKRLAISGAAGLSLFLLSGIVLASTGTSRKLVLPFAPLLAIGTGVFFTTWLADLYGAATGGRTAKISSWVAPIELELGHRYVYDPQFAYRNFGYLRGDFRYRSLRATPIAYLGLDDDNQRVALELAQRMRGRTPGHISEDGSYLDLTSALIYHRYGSEGFAVWTPTLTVDARLDLAHVGPSLRGAFVEGQLGAGLEVYRFDVSGAPRREEAFGLLLARFGFGVYFGRGARRTGELLVYYDHRHDDFAAGMGVRGIGGGVLGHVGTLGHYFFSEAWGASALLEVGSAVVTTVALRYRWRPST